MKLKTKDLLFSLVAEFVSVGHKALWTSTNIRPYSSRRIALFLASSPTGKRSLCDPFNERLGFLLHLLPMD